MANKLPQNQVIPVRISSQSHQCSVELSSMQVPAPPFLLLCCTGGQSHGWVPLFPDILMHPFWLGFSGLIWAPFHMVQPSHLGWSYHFPLLFLCQAPCQYCQFSTSGNFHFFCSPFSNMSCSCALEKMARGRVGGTSCGNQLLKGLVSRPSCWRGEGKMMHFWWGTHFSP